MQDGVLAKTRSAIPVAALTLALTACSTPGTGNERNDDRPLVLTTFTILADMVDNVAADRVEVVSLTRPGAEIHGYEPTPQDLARGQDADLILENGLGLETWLTQFTERLQAPTTTLTQGIDTIPISSGEHQGQPNPHAWMSPDNAPIYIDNIRHALTTLDPDGAHEYTQAAQEYTNEITEVGQHLREELHEIPEHSRALVTCEGAFSYLARDADLTEMYLWPVNSENEGTPQQIATVTEFVDSHDIPTIFCESTVNDSAQRSVARETHAQMGQTLYVDSLSEADGPVPTYLDLLRHDTDAIVAGLSEGR